jgi:hypothetical protein
VCLSSMFSSFRIRALHMTLKLQKIKHFLCWYCAISYLTLFQM